MPRDYGIVKALTTFGTEGDLNHNGLVTDANHWAKLTDGYI